MCVCLFFCLFVMPQSLPPSSNPSFKKHHSFQNKEKIKNWSKSPQNRERTRLGNCSLLLPHREHGKRPHWVTKFVYIHAHTCLCMCVWVCAATVHTPHRHQLHSPEISVLQLQTLSVGKFKITSIQN